jgi:DNA-binding NtrC family response regulator
MGERGETEALNAFSGAPAGPGGVPRAPLAVVLSAFREGRRVAAARLPEGTGVVGAAPDCLLVLDDKSVSRHHLEVTVVAEGVRVRDLASRNGTTYLDQKLGEMTLALGSRLRLGQTELAIEADREDFEGTQAGRFESYGALVGVSPAMQRLFTLLARLEGSLAGVLIEGESGTGKELVARAIHGKSARRAGPFVALNCGALDRSLVRSELFGHKKGAFTGALADAVGAFESAEDGTLFLDEIGELPLDVQPMLLRVLESGEFQRLGETRPRKANARVIAATHRRLADDVAEGLFREDLYYRLRIVAVTVPSLAERRDDLPLLVRDLSARLGLPVPPESLLTKLAGRAFPGNVRELRNALLSYAALGELPPESGTPLPLDDALAPFIDPTRPYAEQKEALVDRMTALYLRALIERTGGNRSEAARVAELQRGYLRRLLEKYGLD